MVVTASIEQNIQISNIGLKVVTSQRYWSSHSSHIHAQHGSSNLGKVNLCDRRGLSVKS